MTGRGAASSRADRIRVRRGQREKRGDEPDEPYQIPAGRVSRRGRGAPRHIERVGVEDVESSSARASRGDKRDVPRTRADPRAKLSGGQETCGCDPPSTVLLWILYQVSHRRPLAQTRLALTSLDFEPALATSNVSPGASSALHRARLSRPPRRRSRTRARDGALRCPSSTVRLPPARDAPSSPVARLVFKRPAATGPGAQTREEPSSLTPSPSLSDASAGTSSSTSPPMLFR